MSSEQEHHTILSRLIPRTKFAIDDRLPLANQLFELRPHFSAAMNRFQRCLPVIPYLQSLPQDGSVEGVLERLQGEAGEYPERHRQLAAIRYYLHLMLWECQARWEQIATGVTNYKTLLDQIERWREPKDPVCLVTFNYDTLLEHALPTVNINIETLPDYIGKDYKIIKLDGSVNWAREVGTHIDNVSNRNQWDIARELIDRAAEIDIGCQDHASLLASLT